MFRGMKVLVGVLAVAFLLLAAGLWLYGYSPANMSRVRAQVCQHRLRRLFRALEQYRAHFAGEYPLNLSGLQPYVTDLVECPDFPTDGAGLKSYVYIRPGGPETPRQPVVYCRAPHHLKGFLILPGRHARNVLYTDGTVKEEPAGPLSDAGASDP